MSRRQTGFLIGFLIAVLGWAAGLWVTLGAILAGLIGYLVVRVLDGDVDLSELADRVSGSER
ncbi:MAG: hypothetical protein KY434_05500 [Actinobacteria bacterium]|nr:hypothetical protein [Actinomycetota bacterium]